MSRRNDISVHEIQRFLNTLSKGEANHCFSAIRALYNWCIQNHYTERNPLQQIAKPHKIQSRERVLTDAELRDVWHHATLTPFPFGHIYKLLLTSGQRLNEITSLEWTWIGETVRFPPEVVKNNTVHEIPVTPLMQEVIETIPRTGPFLFPSTDGTKPYAGHNKAMPKFRAALPHIPPFTCHDARRTFSTIHARIRTPIDIQEALLNHRTGSRSPIQRIYDRYDRMEPMRQAMLSYEHALRSIIGDVQACSAT